MKDSPAVGIMVPSNMPGGVQKTAAVAALDLARNGHRVYIYVPLLPWRFYFISLSRGPKKWLRWVRYAGPILLRWLGSRRFPFQDLISGEEATGRISVHFVPLRASRRQLKHLNCILLYTIAQVDDYADRFPQERQIYLLPHPEEHSHGNTETFQKMRAAFKGKIQVVSPMTGRSISGHAPNYTVTPNPVSQVFWERSRDNAPESEKKDILLAWKDNESGQQGLDLIKSITKRRPSCSLTVWAWSQGARTGAQEALPGVDVVQNISESDLCDLYHQHHMFLYPSNFEGFGIPPIEALASGSIPILRPEVGAAEMYARDGENSIFIGVRLEDVAERVAAVLEDSETMAAMQANGYESIEQFNPNGYGVKILTDAGII